MTVIGLLALLLASPVAPVHASSMPSNLLPNGSFDQKAKAGGLIGWASIPPSTTVTTGEEWFKKFATLRNSNAAGSSGIQQEIILRAEWGKILVRGAVRITNFQPAADGSPTGNVRLRLEWRDTSGKVVAAAAPSWNARTDGWADINQLLDVPAGAKSLIVTPEIDHVVASADFRELSVVAWIQTLRDEFDEPAVDTSIWTFTDSDNVVYAPGIGRFAPSNVSLKDGSAVFHGEYAPTTGYSYKTGELRSVGKFQQLYGYWEFRCRLPLTIGVWPAIYLLKYDDAWPPEIDIEEMSGNDMKTVIETNHFADENGVHGSSHVNFDGTTLDRSQWHTYAIVWEPDSLAYYVDGVYKGTTGPPDGRVSDVPMYVRMNLGIGSYGGDPTKGTWPQDFIVDYARVYQRQDYDLPLYVGPSIEITPPTATADLHAISCAPMTGATATWSLAEGPGPATIAAPHSLDTRVTLTRPGMYRFQIMVTKGASSASKEMLVYLNRGAGV